MSTRQIPIEFGKGAAAPLWPCLSSDPILCAVCALPVISSDVILCSVCYVGAEEARVSAESRFSQVQRQLQELQVAHAALEAEARLLRRANEQVRPHTTQSHILGWTVGFLVDVSPYIDLVYGGCCVVVLG